MDRRTWVLLNVRGKILDIGSQDGWLFRGTSLDVVLLDIDSYKTEFPFVRADAHRLPFKDKSFDTACLCEILEHVQNPIAVLIEAIRVAKRVIVTVPDEMRWSLAYRPMTDVYERMKELGCKSIREYEKLHTKNAISVSEIPHTFHIRWYDGLTLRRHMEMAGFKKIILENLSYDGWSFWVAIGE